MKQFIFIAFALIFTTSLLPANLYCQVIPDGPPVCNLGVPWDHPETHSIKLGNNRFGEEEQKEEMGWEQELIRILFQLNLILNKR